MAPLPTPKGITPGSSPDSWKAKGWPAPFGYGSPQCPRCWHLPCLIAHQPASPRRLTNVSTRYVAASICHIPAQSSPLTEHIPDHAVRTAIRWQVAQPMPRIAIALLSRTSTTGRLPTSVVYGLTEFRAVSQGSLLHTRCTGPPPTRPIGFPRPTFPQFKQT